MCGLCTFYLPKVKLVTNVIKLKPLKNLAKTVKLR